MNKFSKVVMSLSVAGMLFSGAGAADAASYKPAKTAIQKYKVMKQVHFWRSNPSYRLAAAQKATVSEAKNVVKGTFVGWADSGSFEIKTASGYEVLRMPYTNDLKMGSSYQFQFKSNEYGQKIVVKVIK